MKTSGQCLCGEVKLSVDLSDKSVNACHCTMCRTWAAGPFLGLNCESPSFESEDSLGRFRASEWGERVFCKACGSSLFWRMQDGSHNVVSAGAIDLGEDAQLTLQVFIEEKPAYYAFANDTKTMTGEELFAAVTEGKNG